MGIFGPKLLTEHKNAYISMILSSMDRGRDATGSLCLYNNGQSFSFIKDAENAATFLSQKLKKPKETKWQHFWHPNTCAFLGHVRQGTKGKKDDPNNAHPFRKDDIIGFHNGTINGMFPNSTKFDVDSEALFFNLAENEGNIKKTIQQLDKTHNTAYALVWYNHKDKTLHFLRNNQRPLFFTQTDDYLMYASEIETIRVASQWFNLPQTKISSLKEDIHVMYDLTQKNWHNEAKTETIKLIKHIPATPRHISVPSHNAWTEKNRRWTNKFKNKAKTWPKTQQKTTDIPEEFKNTEQKAHDYIAIGPNKQLHRKALEVAKILNKGCNWCSSPTSLDDINEIAWKNHEEFICPNCNTESVRTLAGIK